jgi:hypothetical protein
MEVQLRLFLTPTLDGGELLDAHPVAFFPWQIPNDTYPTRGLAEYRKYKILVPLRGPTVMPGKPGPYPRHYMAELTRIQ